MCRPGLGQTVSLWQTVTIHLKERGVEVLDAWALTCPKHSPDCSHPRVVVGVAQYICRWHNYISQCQWAELTRSLGSWFQFFISWLKKKKSDGHRAQTFPFSVGSSHLKPSSLLMLTNLVVMVTCFLSFLFAAWTLSFGCVHSGLTVYSVCFSKGLFPLTDPYISNMPLDLVLVQPHCTLEYFSSLQ